MIDEKDLDDGEREALGIITNETERAYSRELFRLARLGLWAEKHGVPAVKKALQSNGVKFLEQALAALPRDGKSE